MTITDVRVKLFNAGISHPFLMVRKVRKALIAEGYEQLAKDYLKDAMASGSVNGKFDTILEATMYYVIVE